MTTIQQITSVSKTLAASINQKSRTIKIVSKYSDDVNAQFIGYLTGSLPIFTEKCILEVASLLEQYKCEKLLTNAVDFINSNVPLDRILAEYVELTKGNVSSPVFEKILVDSILTPQTILFEDAFIKLPVQSIEKIFSAQSEKAIPQSFLFAFILIQIKEKQQGAEPLMRFLDYQKLIVPQLMDLRETLIAYHLDSLAYLVIEMIKLRNANKENRLMKPFERKLASSATFSVEYSPCHEFDGVFKVLTKQFGENLITCGAVTFSSSSNDPNKIVGTKVEKNNVWISGNENNPFFQIDSADYLRFNQYRFTGLPRSVPENYSIEVSDDGVNWEEVLRKTKESAFLRIADSMGGMAEAVQPKQGMSAKQISKICNTKHIRLVHNGKNAMGSSRMSLTSFELFYNGVPVLAPLLNGPHQYISITSSSCSYPALVDRTKAGYWCSLDIPNGYIELSFTDFAIAVTGYTLQTYNFNKDMDHLKQWVVFGSLDGETWLEIDRREPNEDLNGVLMFKYYSCKNTRPCRYIRLQIEGENHRGKHVIALSSIELFGLIIPDI